MKILLLISTIIMTVTSRRLFIEDEERSIRREQDAMSVLENPLQQKCKKAWNTFVGKVNEGERIWCDIFGNKAETAKVLDMTVDFTSKCMMKVWRNDPAIYRTYVDKSYICGSCKMEWNPVKERIDKAESNWCEVAACDKMVKEAKYAEAKDVDEFLSACDGDSNEIKNYQDKCKKCGDSRSQDNAFWLSDMEFADSSTPKSQQKCKSLWTTLKAMAKAGRVTWCAICGTSQDLASAMGIGSQTELVSDCIDNVWSHNQQIWDEFYAEYAICSEPQCN